MPNRILRPWTDSIAINQLSAQAEVFFTRLIMVADDYGRFHGNPLLLKSYLFPLKEGIRVTDISHWIAECVTAGVIAEYANAGKRYIEIRNFGQRARTASRFPAPDSDGSHSSDIGQTFDSQLSADCGQLSAPDGGVDGGGDEGGGENPPTRMYTHTKGNYPETVDDVIRIAKSPQVGMKCTKEQATVYLATRQARDWIDSSRVPIPAGRVPADIKRWLIRDEQKQQNERKEKDYYASGRHIGQNGTFRNDPI